MNDLKAHYKIFHPVIALFLSSVRQIRSRFAVARRLLLPRLLNRSAGAKTQHNDMVQWLLDTARGKDSESDQIVKRMLFLNMAAIHTSAEAATNVILDLCARPEDMVLLREEIVEATKKHGGINLSMLNDLRKMDSFIKESNRLNTAGLSTQSKLLFSDLAYVTDYTQ